MEGLEIAQLEQNLLTGTIPNDHGDISKLAQLWSQRNLLTSTIPQWIGQASSLKNLFLHSNLFVGKIPTKLKTTQSFEM